MRLARAALLLVVLALPAPGRAQEASDAAAPATAAVAEQMTATVQSLMRELPAQLVGYGTTGMGNEARFRWQYGLQGRVGLPLFELDPAQRERIWELVDLALGEAGGALARAIVDLESYARENTRDERRDPDWYFLAIFGQPGERGSWAWRFEGHHLSISVTVLESGEVLTTPAFFGAWPATRITSGLADSTPLGDTEAAARALLAALDAGQRRRAVFASAPPDEIITGDDARALRPPLVGVRHDELDPEQQALLLAIAETFARRFAPPLAEARLAAVQAGGLDEVRFGWAGSGTPGDPYYFRVHGPGFVIEQGTFEGDPDHQHSVWRSFDEDFGRRALRAAGATTANATLTQAPPETDPALEAAAAAARRKIEVLRTEVPANGCHATVEVLDRRPLLADDPLPRNFQRDPDLEVITLRVVESTSKPDVENLCETGSEIVAVSPRYPVGGLIGTQVFLDLELFGDGRTSTWRASRIQTRR